MTKFTKKQLLAMVTSGMAKNITNSGTPGKSYNKIGYSAGKNGMTGALFQNKETGEFTSILARNSQLFRYC